MVYAEALSYGLPVIATDVGPIPELVSTAAGRFVVPDDERALARMLVQCLDDDKLLQQLRTGARERAEMLPTWDNTVDGFMNVFSRIRRNTL
jgi:glycosyltransferase involved in cell wall biosynthesis